MNNSDIISSNSNEFKVRVIVDDLEVKDGPGDTYNTVLHIKDRSDYTITLLYDNWGRLKSNLGWVDLNKTKRIN